MWHLDAHVCKESFNTMLIARIPECKVSLLIISVFVQAVCCIFENANAFYFLTAEISCVGIDGFQKNSRVRFTVFKTAFPCSMAILICKYIISAETSVLIRVGFLAEGS